MHARSCTLMHAHVCSCVLMCAQSLSHVWSFATPWTVASQAPLSVGFFRQEYWSGLPFPSPGGLPNPGIEITSPAFSSGFFTTHPPGKPILCVFLELYCFLDNPVMLAIWSLVPLPFLNPVWTSGSSQFTYCWSLAWRILSIKYSLCHSLQWQIYPATHYIRIPHHVMREEGTTVRRISCLEGRIFHTLPPT